MKTRSIVAGSVLALSIAGGIGAGSVFANDTSGPPQPRIIIATSDQLLPSESLTDWSSFSDHLVVVTAVAERKLAATDEEVAAGEGFVPRVLKFQIDSTMWSRPGAPPAPADFETDLDGWVFHGDQLTPLRSEGEPMLEVGKQYVMPIVYLQKTQRVLAAGWSPLAPDTIQPYQAGKLSTDLLVTTKTDSNAVRQQFRSEPPRDLASALSAAAPYPAAASGKTLPADERFSRVIKAHQR